MGWLGGGNSRKATGTGMCFRGSSCPSWSFPVQSRRKNDFLEQELGKCYVICRCFPKGLCFFLVLVYTPETSLILDTKSLQRNLIVKRNISVLSFEKPQPETKARCALRWPSAEGNVCCTDQRAKK